MKRNRESTPADEGAAAVRADIRNDREAVNNLQTMTSNALAAAARGELDLNDLAKKELAARGQDENAIWIGHEAAAVRMTGSMITRANGRRIWTIVPRS